MTTGQKELPSGWKWVKLGDVAEMYQPPTISKKEMSENGEYVVFGANGIIGRYDKFNHEEPQLLITCRGATCGTVNFSTPKAFITGNAMVVSPNQSLATKEFLGFYFKGVADFSKIITGAAQPQITRQNLSPCPVPLPPLEEQQRIAGILNQADELKKLREEADKKTEELIPAIFHEMVGNRINNGQELPSGWKWVKLGDVCEVATGGTPLINKQEYWNGSLPWYSSGELNHARTRESERLVSQKGLENSSAKLFPKGSLLIGMYDTAALKMSILDRNAAFNQAIAGVKPNNHILLDFVMAQIDYFRDETLAKRVGVRQKNLNLTKIRDINLVYPPLEQQKEIVDRLNQAEEIKKTNAESDTKIEELQSSLLQRAFRGEL